MKQAGNFHFACPNDRWRHVRLRGWWLHNHKKLKKMVETVDSLLNKMWDQEFSQWTQMNLLGVFCADFEYFVLTSFLLKSRRIQSLESTKKRHFFENFSAITFYGVRIYSKSLGSAQKALWRYYWDFWWWSKIHPFSEIESTVLKISVQTVLDINYDCNRKNDFFILGT